METGCCRTALKASVFTDPENDREFFQLSHTPHGTLQLLNTYITYFTRSITRERNLAKALRTISPGEEVVFCDGIEPAARSTTDG
jgi:hypothetical protein